MRAIGRGRRQLSWQAIALLLLAAGCDPVHEDRTITWSARGDAVGLQHGEEGVFIANQDGGLKKIFQPGADVLATSPPLWAPAGKRLIFTTARDPEAVPMDVGQLAQTPDPAGRVHFRRPVVYTCWLRDEEAAVKEPVALFEAACDHVGYVAANLAVRWHPQADRILYVQEVGAHRHGVFEYDLRTKTSRRVFPHTAEAVIFDWAADGEHLVCLLGSISGQGDRDGIWIGRPDADWWHVPESAALSQAELPSALERLRATRPAWTLDGRRFAFVSSAPVAGGQKAGRHLLHLGILGEHKTQVLAEGSEPFRDLHWSPDGLRLGLVRGRQNPSLHLIEPGAEISKPISGRSIRRFAGWSPGAKHVAYVVPASIADAGDRPWAFLLVPDPEARDAVMLADGKGGAEREVFSGMRVTFPQWSPTEEKLSVWFTFSPPYRSWLGLLLGTGLRPGDPAAIFDPIQGEITWMAVNAEEKFQIGHHYLLKRQYARAWQWCEEANRELKAPAHREAGRLLDFLTQLAAPRDVTLFEYYCLAKLGRQDEAQAKLEEFERSFAPKFVPGRDDAWLTAVAGDAEAAKELLAELTDPKGLTLTLLRDLYAAEVFLSLDAAEDGEQFFQKGLAQARTDVERFSKAVVLSQFLLLEKKHPAYVDLVTDTIVPLTLKLPQPDADALERRAGHWRRADLQGLVVLASAWPALLPLAVPDFVKDLPEAKVRRLWRSWQEIDAKAGSAFTRQSLDFVRLRAAQRLGLEKEGQELAARVAQQSPNWKETIDTFVQSLRTAGQSSKQP